MPLKMGNHRVKVRDVVFFLMLESLLEVTVRGVDTGLCDGNCGGFGGQGSVAEEVKVVDVDEVLDDDLAVVGLLLEVFVLFLLFETELVLGFLLVCDGVTGGGQF